MLDFAEYLGCMVNSLLLLFFGLTAVLAICNMLTASRVGSKLLTLSEVRSAYRRRLVMFGLEAGAALVAGVLACLTGQPLLVCFVMVNFVGSGFTVINALDNLRKIRVGGGTVS